jgi:hypothetical protein
MSLDALKNVDQIAILVHNACVLYDRDHYFYFTQSEWLNGQTRSTAKAR